MTPFKKVNQNRESSMSASRLLSLLSNLQSVNRLKNISNASNFTGIPLAAETFSSYSTEAERSGLTHLSRPHSDCGVGIFVNLKKESTSNLVQDALNYLAGIKHRGAEGAGNTKDGSGILLYGGLDHFVRKEFREVPGRYALLHVALPKNPEARQRTEELLNQEAKLAGLSWGESRAVPVHSEHLSLIAKNHEMDYVQRLMPMPESLAPSVFDQHLIKLQLRFEQQVHQRKQQERSHILSLSRSHIIFKGMIDEERLSSYFPDLNQPHCSAMAAIIHSRFATNALPELYKVHPFSNIAMNGENNSNRLLVNYLMHNLNVKRMLGLEQLDFTGYSDTAVLSFMMSYLQLLGVPAKTILGFGFQKYYAPTKTATEKYYNLLGRIPNEGPNHSAILLGEELFIVRDPLSLRPQRGVIKNNNEYFFSGSELPNWNNLSEYTEFSLPAATPLLIDLQTGNVDLMSLDESVKQLHEEQIARLIRLNAMSQDTQPPIFFSFEELQRRKCQAGWTQEFNKAIMQPLLQDGQNNRSSMADQSPIEMMVSHERLDIYHFFKARFAQVTNPAVARYEEQSYLSTEVFLGRKPSLLTLDQALFETPGVLLQVPVIDSLERLQLQQQLPTVVLDITYAVANLEQALLAKLAELRQAAIEAAKAGAVLLVLSDLVVQEGHFGLPGVLAVSVVNQALREAGLRDDVSLLLESADVLSPREIALAISVGGAEAVYPYLVYHKDPVLDVDARAYHGRRESYKQQVKKELLAYMGRQGLLTLSAYRDQCGFTAMGLSQELAALFGVENLFHHYGVADLARTLQARYSYPEQIGLGIYPANPSHPARPATWRPEVTTAALKALRIEDAQERRQQFKAFEKIANMTKGQPHHYMSRKRLTHWTAENPMPVCVMGGGAAGFYCVEALLKLNLPLKITVVEARHANVFGLISDGVSPDHGYTKKQAEIFVDTLKDPSVHYRGGIAIDAPGGRVTTELLKESFACVIDARGAPVDRRLNIPGEDNPRVFAASQVYRAYNGEFKPDEQPCVVDWPFSTSRSRRGFIIGSGNVAIDIARILLSSPADLESTRANPFFVEQLPANGPEEIHLFSRSNPAECKMSLRELKELLERDISLQVDFDPTTVHRETLTSEQAQRYDFFDQIRNQPIKKNLSKRLFFHFNYQPINMATNHHDEIDVVLKDTITQTTHRFHGAWCVSAIGTDPVKTIKPVDERVGWVRGEGGVLADAKASAEQVAQRVAHKFRKGSYNDLVLKIPERNWEMRALTNQEVLNLIDWLKAGNPLRTLTDFNNAKTFQRPAEPREEIASEETKAPSTIKTTATAAQPGKVGITSSEGDVFYFDPLPNKTLLQSIQEQTNLPKNLVPQDQCGGKCVCGSCRMTVASHKSTFFKMPSDAVKVLKAVGGKKEDVLSCVLSSQDAAGNVFTVPTPSK